MEVTRRRLIGAAAAAGLLAACSPGSSRPAGTSTAAGSLSASGGTPLGPPTSEPSAVATSATPVPATPVPATPAPSPSVATAALPTTAPWRPRPGEVEPAVKAQATRLLEAVGAWAAAGGGSRAAARARAKGAGFDPALADALVPLLGAGEAAAVQVVDAQYGGILASSASVLVVLDQWRAPHAGAARAGGTTVDVRLVRDAPRWRVVEVHPAAPGPASSSLTRSARAVLADARIRLPFAAHADVVAGRIHDSVLTLLLALADQHVVDVSVLRSGHPLLVFGTSRRSAHPLGRAVDVWALDGRPLVLARNEGLASSAMRFAVAHGATNVGGPVLLDGPAYFSDDTHQDHIHLGLPV